MNLRPWMKCVIPVFFIIASGVYIPSLFIDNSILEIVGVTLITTFYHTCVRPLTGSVINAIYHNKMDFTKWWFKEKKIEKPVYKFLKVHKWKNVFPTYDKSAFDFKKKSIEEILGATCQAEVVHEIMFLLSFLPLFMIIPYGRAVVFIITSVLCALIESVFIIIQRYNRPRLLKLYKRKTKWEMLQ